MTALWIVVAVVLFVNGAAIVLGELYDARREMEHLPVDIDRYTRAARARAKRTTRKGEDTQDAG